MKAAIFSNLSPRVGFGVDRKMAVSRSQVMVVAASRNQKKGRVPNGFAAFFVSGVGAHSDYSEVGIPTFVSFHVSIARGWS